MVWFGVKETSLEDSWLLWVGRKLLVDISYKLLFFSSLFSILGERFFFFLEIYFDSCFVLKASPWYAKFFYMGVWLMIFLFSILLKLILNRCLNFVTFLTVLFEICLWATGLMSSVPIYPCVGRNFHLDFSITVVGVSFEHSVANTLFG